MEKDIQHAGPPARADHIDQWGREIEPSPASSETAESFSEDGTTAERIASTEMEPADAQELRRLATAFSQRSGAGGQPDALSQVVSFNNSDPSLSPTSKEFDAAKWARNVVRQIEDSGNRPARTGIMFKDLTVSGTGDAVQLQQTVDSVLAGPLQPGQFFHLGKKAPKKILNKFDGVLGSGELLIVLGRPGSGCSTLLKTMCGELNGLSLGKESTISYDGISQPRMKKEFKGEAIYNQEVDKHFPHLTVGQTLEFAAAIRTPSDRFGGMSRSEYSKLIAQVTMAICGLTHTYNTKVGDDFVRGVSGGERKRVSIAEMMLATSPFAAWDNSTRGLDSATALKFVQTLRLFSDIFGASHAVAIYQASQDIYDLFDKATVLYEGRQIYFGPAKHAKAFFERQGWSCPSRQTTGDFLTSITNPSERRAREGMESKVPRTPEDFERYWHSSHEFRALQEQIARHAQEYPISDDEDARQTEAQNETLKAFRETKDRRQPKYARRGSPYIVTVRQQISLNTKRAYQRIWGDKASTVVNAVMQVVIALVMGSIFYSPTNYDSTAGFYSKGAALFIAVLSSAMSSVSEISNLYAQRPIVEKHASYAFYHPATEAIAGIVADIPVKFFIAVCFNPVIYFMAGLRREPAQFFLYFLVTYVATFVFAGIFRTVAAITRTSSQAMTLAGILILALTIYTGFVIAVPQMHVWFSWIRWLNPLFYAFEILVSNEFHGREYICSSIIPSYTPLIGDSWVCNAVGAVAGRATVSGDAYIGASYTYYYSHVWRNLGILFGFLVFFTALYVIASELNSSMGSTAEFLVFQRGRVPAYLQEKGTSGSNSQETRPGSDAINDSGANVGVLEPQKDIFTWRDVTYDIQIKGEERRLLDHVSGWVKPGTLTTLMGVSGAGKTTLLDVLAQRTSMGVITGDMLVNGKPLDESFQRKTGYVQQQDLHLETATVRESLRFSAMLRQPQSVSKAEKYQYVEDVIEMLNMGDFADAVVGIPGEGLNVEQRKLLTIGVELAAKPKLLLFLDEPTSGLDSQSSWAIVSFLRKLANAGQAVLCTIHQPSAILFQEFDRLLFLARGGRTVYFGDIGKDSHTLLEYFESNGARKCGTHENPAEYMLEIANGQTADWHSVWLKSQERKNVEAEIDRIAVEMSHEPESDESGSHSEFAMPFSQQLISVTTRVFQQYWRMPSYVFAKFILGVAAGLFIGFSFWRGGGTLAGMQNSIFSTFQIVTLFSTIVQQVQPLFITQRSLYEVRERPSKAYSWKAFMIANVVVEIPYQIVTGTLIWACFYYPVVGAGQSSERQALVWLLCVVLQIYASSFAQMTIAALPDATTAGAVVTLLMLMSLMFCGVLQTPTALPGFWIFMYHLSPFTYWISAMTSTMLHGRSVTCSETETTIISPPSGQTCGEYFSAYLSGPGGVGTLQNPGDTSDCRYCSISVADQYLSGSGIYWEDRWRNFGILWAYIIFNIFIAVGTYYLFRVRPTQRSRSSKGKKV
ncbi:hypothetical protein VSDG_08497 [Cytospora chrysosperma]|uniref:ABC transporter domain-containing protein n=1 Tax=Cytospora chrysosperma TaxID=252740 RepID=A0A423VEV7_CYTCH|nr:hypothetical protein VSDG_08497 [Valsa sordida]